MSDTPRTDEVVGIANMLNIATKGQTTQADYNALAEHARQLERELNGLREFKRGVDEALNSGDGVYRP